jgi:hypothetical protein
VDLRRDRDGTFEPRIVPKRARRLSGVDELVISLVATGLTTGEVQAHLTEAYGAAPGGLIIDVDAMLLECHSDNEQAVPTYKSGFATTPSAAEAIEERKLRECGARCGSESAVTRSGAAIVRPGSTP